MEEFVERRRGMLNMGDGATESVSCCTMCNIPRGTKESPLC